MALINVSNLTFAYEGSYDNIFENASFQIDTDWKLGFIGRNGKGKTTFLKLLLGEYDHQGSISRPVDFEYFPYEVEDKSLNSIDIAFSIAPELELWRLLKEVNLLEMEEELLYRPFSTLSSGEQTKLLLALLFQKESSFLLIDEPTNHLDSNARKLVGSYLDSKKSYILVSHDRGFLDGCIDHVLSINRADIQVQKGNFSSWYLNKTRRDEAELQENERLKREIDRLNQSVRRTADWSDKVEKSKIGAYDKGYIGHKAAKMMQRSKAIEKRRQDSADKKSALLKNIERVEKLKLHPLEYHSQRLVGLDDIAISYGEKTACQGVSFTISRGDRLALQGKNGSGKSSILRLIAGEKLDHSGNLSVGSGLKISLVPQNFSQLEGNLSDYAALRGIDETLFKAILRKLDFERNQFDKDMAKFSAGQKKKVLIAGSLCESAHLYIWDEPLNYIDVFSRIQIESLLEDFGPTMLFVEHDRAFVDKISTGIVYL
ncbi:MAG: ribosomal protection-like ABC-F family protein [Christensenellales bacterium]|jgi:lincosamide and streptogramin A transport system ATP-binding/permease protein